MSVKIVDSSATSAAPRQRNRNLKVPDEEEGGMERDLKNRSEERLSPMPRSAGVESSQSRRIRLKEGIQELTFSLDQGFQDNKEDFVKFWDQFTRKGKSKVGVLQSLNALLWSSCTRHNLFCYPWTEYLTAPSPPIGLNIFLVVIPIAWVSHFRGWNDILTFVRELLFRTLKK